MLFSCRCCVVPSSYPHAVELSASTLVRHLSLLHFAVVYQKPVMVSCHVGNEAGHVLVVVDLYLNPAPCLLERMQLAPE